MNRLTRTKLEKLLYIHNCRVDQIVDEACSKLDKVAFDLITKPRLDHIVAMTERGLSALQGQKEILRRQAGIAQASPLWVLQEQAARQDYSAMNTPAFPHRFYNPL